jgi:hypothetical protein
VRRTAFAMRQAIVFHRGTDWTRWFSGHQPRHTSADVRRGFHVPWFFVSLAPNVSQELDAQTHHISATFPTGNIFYHFSCNAALNCADVGA